MFSNRTMIKTVVSIALLTTVFQTIYSCQSKHDITTMQYLTNGQKLYGIHCQNCHGLNGEGLGKLYPPLTDSIYLKNNRHKLPQIVKFGMKGEVIINGEQYNEVMPGLTALADIEIAYILTYITLHFGSEKERYTLDEVQKSLKEKL